jgi:DNA-binding NarL/FixJ family response regulator
MKRITVLLAEDHTIVREGLRKLLELEKDLQIVGEAADGRAAVALVKKLRPAVVLMDIAMPLLNGLEATRQIRKDFPSTRVLILSAHSHAAFIDQAIEFGAAGFLLKQTSPAVLATAIREVQKGSTFFSPAIGSETPVRDQPSPKVGKPFKKKNNRLSPREMEVLQLIAEGQPNKQVAAELGVSFKTVDKHRQHLMGKLNIHDVAGLTRYALAEGIIESNDRPPASQQV